MNNVIAPTLPAKPFLKWAGGKGKLLPQLDPLFPKNIGYYFEPFLGGGAVFFHLQQKHPSINPHLSDFNRELVITWQTVKNQTIELIEQLQTYTNDKAFFQGVRCSTTYRAHDVAARLIYLNRTCYNGLYRVNSKGEFNVPFGNYKDPTICDTDNLISCHRALRSAVIKYQSFEEALYVPQIAACGPDTFVYCDPPYMPVSATSNFTSYTSDGFSFDQQKLLAKRAHQLKDKGVKIMLSNSDTKEIRALYQGFDIQVIEARRSIACTGAARVPVKELVIRSYT